ARGLSRLPLRDRGQYRRTTGPLEKATNSAVPFFAGDFVSGTDRLWVQALSASAARNGLSLPRPVSTVTPLPRETSVATLVDLAKQRKTGPCEPFQRSPQQSRLWLAPRPRFPF